MLCAAIVAGAAVYYVCQKNADRLEGRARRAESERKTAVARLATREAELQGLRTDAAELARLKEQLKTNAAPAAAPTGFYLGAQQPVYVAYGTPDPVLQSFIKSLMESNQDPKAKGEAIFQKICAACHQRDGMGKDGTAPPLVGSEWTLAPGGERLVRIVLNGVTGPITVQGREWNLPMPPWRDNLDDGAISAALTYIRTQLGANNASAINAETVAAARKDLHPGPETASELSQISAK